MNKSLKKIDNENENCSRYKRYSIYTNIQSLEHKINGYEIFWGSYNKGLDKI